MEHTDSTLWHANFLRVVFANLMACISTYMFFPVVPLFLRGNVGRIDEALVGTVVLFLAGWCLCAPFSNYLLDTYRRKNVVLCALVGLMGTAMCFTLDFPMWMRFVVRFLQGASYGIFQVALGSTLLLDLTDTRMRTAGAHVYYWFSRVAMIFGLFFGHFILVRWGVSVFIVVSLVLLACAGMLLLFLQVPFRAPLEPPLYTTDRFWLVRGSRLFFSLFIVTFLTGFVLGQYQDAFFYILVAIGFWFSLLIHQLFLRERFHQELAIGFFCLLAGSFMGMLNPLLYNTQFIVAICMGSGIGFVTSRFLLSYVRVCGHCERGTAQSSYLLGWDAGILSGYSLSVVLLQYGFKMYHVMPFVLSFAAWAFYIFFIKKWYERVRCR